MHEQPKRSLLKTISWRALATTATILIVYIFTRELVISLGIGIVEVLLKMALYYGHERIWEKVRWGRVVGAERQ